MTEISLDALDLAQYIRPGDGIVVGSATGEPMSLTERLVQQRADFSGASVFCGPALFSRTFDAEHADHLRFSALGGIGSLRKLVKAGALDVIPTHMSAVEPLLRQGLIRADVVLLMGSAPDAQGQPSFGLVNDVLRTAMQQARVVIAELSTQVPWTHCEAPLRADEITVAVRTDRAPIELPAASFGELERRIAAHVMDQIPERATLQVGVGAIPEAIAAMLSDRRELGVHSGMIGDAVADLMERGVVTNAHKGVDAGVTITGALYGTRRLYDFAHRNPQIRVCPTSRTHAFASLSQVRRLVSINSALEVDLTGQVNAEAVGAEHIGAVGGQVDFVRAASQSEEGVSIIALPSTGRNAASRIVAALSGPVTTPRSDVDVVATEHGIARLRGKSLRERVLAMAGIAAPEHRDGILAAAKAAGLLR